MTNQEIDDKIFMDEKSYNNFHGYDQMMKFY